MKQWRCRENEKLRTNGNEVKCRMRRGKNIPLYIATLKNKSDEKIFFEEADLLKFLQENQKWTGKKVGILVKEDQNLEVMSNSMCTGLSEVEKYKIFKKNLKKEYYVYALQIYLKYTSELLSPEVLKAMM